MMVMIISLPMASASTVSAHGMNTCNKGWYKTGGTFENYCPNCHHHGTLRVGIKRYDEFTCLDCDSDFCFCGKEKVNYGASYLIKAKKVIKDTVKKVADKKKQLSPKEHKKRLLIKFITTDMSNGISILTVSGINTNGLNTSKK